MGRRRKQGFTNMKMLSSRVEAGDFDKLEYILKTRDAKTLQEFVNIVVRNYVSGTVGLSGSSLVCLPPLPSDDNDNGGFTPHQ